MPLSGNLMHVMLYTKPYICFTIRVMSRYDSNLVLGIWVNVKHMLKYLRRMKEYMYISLR